MVFTIGKQIFLAPRSWNSFVVNRLFFLVLKAKKTRQWKDYSCFGFIIFGIYKIPKQLALDL